MTNTERDAQYEVLFDGTQELLEPRESRTSSIWQNPYLIPPKSGGSEGSAESVRVGKRIYNKSGKYAKDPKFWDRLGSGFEEDTDE